MYIKEIQIKNYRNFYSTNISLNDGVNIIAGPNNSGKSNFLRVVNFLYTLPESNIDDINKNILCFEPEKYKEAPPSINIIYKLQHVLNYEKVDSALQKLNKFIDYDDNGELELIDDKKNEYLINATIEIKYELDAIKLSEYKDEISKCSKIDYNNLYSVISKFKEFYKWKVYNSKTQEEIDFKEIKNIFDIDFIEANRDVESLEGHTIKYISDKLKDKKENLAQLKEKLATEIKDTLLDITNSIDNEIDSDQDEIGISDGKNKVKSTIKYDPNFASYFQYELEDIDQCYRMPISNNGLGYNNLICLRNLIKQKQNNDYNILMIEEPESHLHPNMQYKLLKYINSLTEQTAEGEDYNIRNQIIITTHSPNISASANLDEMILFSYDKSTSHMPNIIATNLVNCFDTNFVAQKIKLNLDEEGNEKQQIKYKEELKELNEILLKSKKHLQKFLDTTRSEMLFSQRIILVEGLAEKILLPKIALSFNNNYDLVKNHVSVIDVSGITFNNFIPILLNEHIKILIITDTDFNYFTSKKNGEKTILEYNDIESFVSNTDEKINKYFSKLTNLNICTQKNYGSTFETELFLDNLKFDNKSINLFNFVFPDGLKKFIKQENYENNIEYWNQHVDSIDNPSKKVVEKYLAIFYDPYNTELDLDKKNLISNIFLTCLFYNYAKEQKGDLALDISLDEGKKIQMPDYIKGGLEWLLSK